MRRLWRGEFSDGWDACKLYRNLQGTPSWSQYLVLGELFRNVVVLLYHLYSSKDPLIHGPVRYPNKNSLFSKLDFGTILCSIVDSLSGTVRRKCACATVCVCVSHVPRKICYTIVYKYPWPFTSCLFNFSFFWLTTYSGRQREKQLALCSYLQLLERIFTLTLDWSSWHFSDIFWGFLGEGLGSGNISAVCVGREWQMSVACFSFFFFFKWNPGG